MSSSTWSPPVKRSFTTSATKAPEGAARVRHPFFFFPYPVAQKTAAHCRRFRFFNVFLTSPSSLLAPPFSACYSGCRILGQHRTMKAAALCANRFCSMLRYCPGGMCMFSAFFRDLRTEFAGYNADKLLKDVMAGLTVCAVALPLALAFGVRRRRRPAARTARRCR